MLLDTSAWIEYFKGTDLGENVKEIVKSDKTLFTNLLTIAELTQWADKYSQDKIKILGFVYQRSKMLELSYEILENAGVEYNKLRKIKEKIGMIDVIIYTSVVAHNLILLTKDRDFEGLVGVELLK